MQPAPQIRMCGVKYGSLAWSSYLKLEDEEGKEPRGYYVGWFVLIDITPFRLTSIGCSAAAS